MAVKLMDLFGGGARGIGEEREVEKKLDELTLYNPVTDEVIKWPGHSASAMRKRIDKTALARELESHSAKDDEMDTLIYSRMMSKPMAKPVDALKALTAATERAKESVTALDDFIDTSGTSTAKGWGSTALDPNDPDYVPPVMFSDDTVVRDWSVTGDPLHERRDAVLASLIMVRASGQRQLLGTKLSRIRRLGVSEPYWAMAEHLKEVLHLANWCRGDFDYSNHHNYQEHIKRDVKNWDKERHDDLCELVDRIKAGSTIEHSRKRAPVRSDAPDALPAGVFSELEAISESELVVAERAVW